MTKFQETVQFAKSLSPKEKLDLLKAVFGDTSEQASEDEGIEKTTGVCGGSARIRNTRIPVWSIVEAKKMNFSDTRILASYPSLSLMDIENALIYYARNREEVELDLAENNEA